MNLLITFLLSGLWHGAGWLFILWGLLHGMAMCVQRTWNWLKLPCPRWAGHALTFLFVMFAWVLFRAPSLEAAGRVYASMLDLRGLAHIGAMLTGVKRNNVTMLLAGLLMAMLLRDPAVKIERFRFNRLTEAATIILLLLSIFSINKFSPFIYFNF
jgi:D-alanyl-lipoteichoic acid acyltransferase DltB (MBOAT superfamily)